MNKEWLHRGLAWQVRDGKNIFVWNDNWIHTLDFLKPIGPPPEDRKFMRVCELIDEVTKSWKTEMLDHLFFDEVSREIQKIPISQVSTEDRLVWQFTKNMTYSVRSDYHFLQSQNTEDNNDLATHNEMYGESKNVWRKLWNAQVPLKVRFFGWRLCQDIIPMYASLSRRKIMDSPICPRCTNEEETSTYAIRDCRLAREAWAFLSCKNEWSGDRSSNAIQWFTIVTKNMPKEHFEEGLVVMWALWNWRNKKIKEGVKIDAKIVVRRSLSYLHEFKKAQLKEANLTTALTWKPPDGTTYKVNFDGAVHMEEAVGGAGVVIRDWRGHIIGAMHATTNGISTAELAEAKAATIALNFAKDLGLSNIILEGDASNIITAINSSQLDLSPIGNLIEEVRAICKDFRACQTRHVKREANMAAHTLAKEALIVRTPVFWVEECPECIRTIVETECNLIGSNE
ncbi:hypothetical protein PTKIN_Ptkin16aG0079000 [Pterospermum kingtungense]